MPMTLTKKSRLSSPRGVNSSTGPRCARSDTGVQAVELIGEGTGLELGALVGFLGRAGEGRVEHLCGAFGCDDRRAVGVEHHQVTGADERTADGHGLVELAGDV